jgi:ABC-type sugar transport system substrate-binding protein
MKKLLAILLALVMALTLCACGTVNEADVALLWSDDNTQALVPNSLINAVDRAMYIENIRYTHYAAGGDAEKQLQQLDQVLHDRCAGVLVELVDPAAAQTIVDHCKEHGIPVVFFNCAVDKAVVDGYDKCAVVTTDETTLAETYGKMIGQSIVDNFKAVEEKPDKTVALDRNGDGVIAYCPVGDVSALAEAVNQILQEAGLKPLQAVEGANMDSVLAENNDEHGNMIELVITASDEDALEVLAKLQSIGYNSDRLKTHCIPLFTVGANADASAFTDTSQMTQEELAVLIYNAMNLVDAGRVAGTAMENYDGLAVAAASILGSFMKGEAVENTAVLVPYTIYTK